MSIYPIFNRSRRAFLLEGSLLLTAAHVDPQRLVAGKSQPDFRVGLVTDLHHADKPPAGTRHYRESLTKLREARTEFANAKPAFIAELGDFIDAADSVEQELEWLRQVQTAFAELHDQRHYVLGNHCVDTLTKNEFLDTIGKQHSYYAFDQGDFRFVVLDSCFRSDGQPYQRRNFKWTDANVPAEQLDWLRDDLRENRRPTLVLAHQRLDVDNHYGVRNQRVVRQILEHSGQVLAVFQGHNHVNDVKEINGIPYCTLVAMVEGSGPHQNGYSILDIHSDRTLQLHGFRNQQSRKWTG